jgi:glycosyltransferase involved in cell wall biosynthesis
MTNREKIMLDVSVIICAYTEERWDDLVAAVESVRRQTIPAWEIMVVIDHNPKLLQRAREFLPDIVVIENNLTPGAGGARNCAAALAGGAVIAFLDDDAVAEPDWLEQCLEHYCEPQVLGVGGALLPEWVGKRPKWFPDEFNWVVGCTYKGLPEATSPVRNLIAANMSVRKEIFVGAGGFLNGYGCFKADGASTQNPLLRSCAGDEETEFCIRATQRWPGHYWLYAPQAVVRHKVPAKRTQWRYFLSRCYDEGYGKAVLSRLVGSRDGLAAERLYTLRTLPLGVVRGLGEALSGRDMAGLTRAVAIVAGLAVTASGYLIGLAHTRLNYQSTIGDKFGQMLSKANG